MPASPRTFGRGTCPEPKTKDSFRVGRLNPLATKDPDRWSSSPARGGGNRTRLIFCSGNFFSELPEIEPQVQLKLIPKDYRKPAGLNALQGVLRSRRSSFDTESQDEVQDRGKSLQDEPCPTDNSPSDAIGAGIHAA